MPIPLLPWQLPSMHHIDVNARINHHLALRAQLWHPANVQIAAQRGVAACISTHSACGCAHSHTRSTSTEQVLRYMHMHTRRAWLHAGWLQLLRRLLPGSRHGTAGVCPA